MATDPSENTVVVAIYPARHYAEIAKDFLSDKGFDALIVADDVHVPVRLTEGARLLVVESKAPAAHKALEDAGLLPETIAEDAELLSAGAESIAMSTEETKACPYCAETIKYEAVICRFCQMDLTTGQPLRQSENPSAQAREVQARSGVADGVKLGCGMFIVLPILILLGLLILVMIFGSL